MSCYCTCLFKCPIMFRGIIHMSLFCFLTEALADFDLKGFSLCHLDSQQQRYCVFKKLSLSEVRKRSFKEALH